MALSRGVRLGPYEIVAPLGAGGMGAVYRATDTRLGRTVAIKVLPDHAAADPQRRLRFEQEARAVSALNHPNICVLYDVGREKPTGGSAEGGSTEHFGPVDFLVMEHLEGETLSRRLREGGVSFEEALEIGAQVADALAKAHRHGVVHRDLKPGNVMLSKTGARYHAKLLDFGLAKLRPGLPSDLETTHPRDEPATRPGAVLGTIPYMSPEQLEGKPTDGRTDIFALGCVLYEMVTGRRAFGGESEASIISAIMAKEPAPVGAYMPAAPLALDHLIVRCLQKDPEERAESAHDVAEELRWIRQTHRSPSADGETLRRRATDSASSQSQSLPGRTSPKPGKRWRKVLLAIGAPVIAVGAYAFVAHDREWWPWTDDPFRNAQLITLTSESTAQTDPAVSPDGQQVAYVSNAGGVTRIWLAEADASARHPLTDGGALDEDPAWSPDGHRVYFTRRQGLGAGIWWVPRINGVPTQVVENAAEPAVSPDGRRLAFVRDISSQGRVFVAPLSSPAEATQVTHDEDGKWDHGHPSWSPDGQWLCYHAQDQLWVVRPDGTDARPITFDNESAIDPVWSHDGKSIYYWSNREGGTALWKVAASGRTPPQRLSLSGAGITRELSLSLNGSAAAYSSGVANLDIMVRGETGEKPLPNTSMHLDMMPRYAPEPNSVVFVSDREDNRVELWVQPLDPPNARPWRLTYQPGGEANHPAVSKDGRSVAYYRTVNGRRHIWTVPLKQGAAPTQITLGPDDLQPAWSPDGTQLAFASQRGGRFEIWTVRLAKAQTPREELQITHGQGRGMKQAPEWSPDGKSIAYVVLPEDRRSEPAASDGTPDDLGIWLVQADGKGDPTRIRNSEGAIRVRWLENDRMIASGQWGDYVVSLRSLNPWTGERTPLRFPVVFGYNPSTCDFDFDIKRQTAVFAAQNGALNIYLAKRR